MFKSNIHHKTRQSPLKTWNTGGQHNSPAIYSRSLWLDYGIY